jgi:hypothetical protein
MDTVTTGWRRLPDEPQRRADAPCAGSGQALPVNTNEAQQMATWENEGAIVETARGVQL